MKKLAIFIVLAGAVFFSCKKNDSGSSGTPIINQVRAVDSTKRDSSFTEAKPGDLIVIQGTNLGGLQAVYFNDTSAYFNPSYATSTNVIINIPSTAQTVATDPNVPSTIRLVTDHGTATYSFSLYLQPPYINSISFDNTGKFVFINGGNFVGVQKITFPIPGAADTALSFTVDKAGKVITAEIPPGTAVNDSLRVYCTFGSGAYSYPPPMSITSVSNENGTAGTTIIITGTNLIGVDKVLFPGGNEGTNIQSLSVTQISVTVPSGITAPDSLRITGGLGNATAPRIFDSYLTPPSPGYLSTFENQWNSDNTGYTGWTATYHTAPSTTYPNSTGNFVSITGPAPAIGSYNWWYSNGMGIQGNSLPWVSNPSSAKASDYLLKFEAYVNFDWKSGGVYITTKSAGGGHLYEWAPWQTAPGGVYHPSGWVTVTIPLTSIRAGTYDASTFWQYNPSGNSPSMVTDLTGSTGTDALFAYFTNFTGKDIAGIDIAFDNFRIVKAN
jgi:hypothetical protein